MLPITKVILYKHGVGYFERMGTVTGNATVDLQFHSKEMNDVLKSLTTLDMNGGVIASISYESVKSTEQQLQEVSVRLADKNSVTDLIRQIKGAKVKVVLSQEEYVGTVIGNETVTKQDHNITVTNDYMALIIDGEKIKSFNLLDVGEIVLLDEDLKRDLQHVLDVLLSANKKELKKLTIFTQGEGERSLITSYIVESPVWKTSYRMLLDDNKPVIQGWALVDNTQEEDWENVNLSLVAGLPISFVHDLYSPRYRRRPIVEVQEEEAYAPPELEDTLDDFDVQDMKAGEAVAMESLSMPAPMPKRSRSMQFNRQDASRSSVEVHTRTSEIGDLFQYEITHPVNVKRGHSALVPILQSDFKGKRIALYNPDVREKNPMSAVLFNNTTGLTLEGGPVTVMEDNTYVGEAMLNSLQPDEEKIIPYSVELGCNIVIDHHSRKENIHFSRITHGKIYFYRYCIDETIYKIRNKTKKEMELHLDHRFHKGWEVVGENKPKEETENFYRFQLIVPADKSIEYIVQEKGDEYEYHNLTAINTKNIQFWLKKNFIDKAISLKLDQVHVMTYKLNRLGKDVEQHEKGLEEIVADQKRFRENLKSLRDNQNEKALRERYVSELSSSEDLLKILREKIKSLHLQMNDEENKLNEFVNNLAFENYC